MLSMHNISSCKCSLQELISGCSGERFCKPVMLQMQKNEKHSSEPTQNAVLRLASLPIVHSACGIVSILYCEAKGYHPYVMSVCEILESGMKTITSVTYNRAAPVIIKLEPQISIANGMACKGLDILVNTFPILCQPSGQVAFCAKNMMWEARDVVSTAVCGAKVCVCYLIDDFVGNRKEETDKTIAVTGALSPNYEKNIRLAGLDITSSKMEEDMKTLRYFNLATASYSVPLVYLAALCNRAFLQAKTHVVQVCSPQSQGALQDTLGVFDSWILSHNKDCNLGPSLRSLPYHIQQQAVCMLLCATQIYNNFFHDNTSSEGGRDTITATLNYLVNTPPLNWLVGPLFSGQCPVSHQDMSKSKTRIMFTENTY